MFAIALQTIRGRWVSFVGMFIALFMGVGFLTVMFLTVAATLTVPVSMPERFVKAPVVIYPSDTLRIQTNTGLQTVTLERIGSLSDVTVDEVRALGRTVVDRAVPAQMPTVAEQQVGRAWSSAAFGSYAVVAGREPQTAREVVVGEGQAELRQSVRIITPEGPQTYVVSGLVHVPHFESPIFFADTEAARLSPAVKALVSFAPLEEIRQVVGDNARVLTGAERYLADPDPYFNQRALTNMQILLGIAGGFTTFVAIFVVASTFAFVVAQRQREFALLRAIGAMPTQIRRMVLLETLLLGFVASLCGSVAGALAAPLFTDWLIRLGVAPSWFTAPIAWLPVILACAMGAGVAILGTLAASLRASRAQPLAALRTAALDEQGMTKARWIWACSVLILGLTVVTWITYTQPRLSIIPQIYFGVLILPIIAAALFAPVVVSPLTRVITWPLRQRTAGMLARQSALVAVRRTVAAAIPVLLIVGLFVSLLGATDAIAAAKAAELAGSIKADYVVVPDHSATLSRQAIENVRTVSSSAATMTPLNVFALDDGELRAYDAEAIEPNSLSTMVDVPVLAGSLDNLRDDTIIVSENWEKEVGQNIDVWFEDGSKKVFTVAAVIKTRINPMDAYITPVHVDGTQVKMMYVKSTASVPFVTFKTATEGQGVRVMSAAEWTTPSQKKNVQASHVGMILTLGVIGVYSAIALINTLVISASGRFRDVVALRLAGATHSQIYWFITTESLLVVGLGTALALASIILNSVAHHLALARLVPDMSIEIPWTALTVTTSVCLVLAIAASIIPIALALRKGLPKIYE